MFYCQYRPMSFYAAAKNPTGIRKIFLSLLISCLGFLLPACKDAGPAYRVLDFGSFKMTAKQDWEIFREKGIDSYVGGLTNGKDSLWFDYGWYSAELGDYPDTSSLYAWATINGLEAMFKVSKNRQTGSVAMSIPQVTKKNRFYIGGNHLSNPEAIITMLKTIRFKESDTTKNSDLVFTDFDKYGGRSGAYIVHTYCVSCHHRMREATGPPLNHKLVAQRTEAWLMLFFTDREKVAGDSLLLSRKQKYDGHDCYVPKELSHYEIKRLIEYLKD